MGILFGIVIVVGLLVAWFLSQRIVNIPPQYCAVVTKGGKRRVISEGFHLVKYPLERLLSFHWSFTGENGQEVISGHRIPLTNMQMNSLPKTGYTKTNVSVNLDGTLQYQITDPEKAVTATTNLLGYLDTCVAAATVEVISCYDHDKLQGQTLAISREMVETINVKLANYGVRCYSFIVEKITMDQTIQRGIEQSIIRANAAATELAANEAQHGLEMQRREHESAMQNARIEFQRKQDKASADAQAEKDHILHARQLAEERRQLDLLAIRQEQQQAENALERQKLEAQMQMEGMRRQAEEEKQRRRNELEGDQVERLIKMGMSPEHIVQLKIGVDLAKAVASGAKTTDKWIVTAQEMQRMYQNPFACPVVKAWTTTPELASSSSPVHEEK